MAGRFELNFIPDDDAKNATNEQLLLQFVYGLCGALTNPREEKCSSFVTAEGIPLPEVRRLIKLLVVQLNLPIPVERVDEWIEWRRNNSCWIVSDEMSKEWDRLTKLVENNE